AAIVVADVKAEHDPAPVIRHVDGGEDGAAEHPDNIPKASGFILARHAGWDGHELVKHRTREKHREPDARFSGGLRDFDLKPVSDRLRAGVSVDHRTEWRVGVFVL